MALDKVKIGDTIIVKTSGYMSGEAFHEVERLTKTQVITKKGVRFNKISGYLVGESSGYCRTYASVPTEEDYERVRNKCRIKLFRRALRDLDKVSDKIVKEDLKVVSDLLNKLEGR